MASMVSDLTEYLAKALVDDPESVKVNERTEDGRVIVHLDVAEDDWGKVIGRGGRVATALRTLLKAAAVRQDCRVGLEIGD